MDEKRKEKKSMEQNETRYDSFLHDEFMMV